MPLEAFSSTILTSFRRSPLLGVCIFTLPCLLLLKKLINISPNLDEAYINYSILMYKQENFAKALNLFLNISKESIFKNHIKLYELILSKNSITNPSLNDFENNKYEHFKTIKKNTAREAEL